MKLQLIAVAAAAALASGAGAAFAAEQHAMSNHSATMQPAPKDKLALNRTQKRIAWRDIRTSSETTPSNFTATVGANVPDNLSIQPMPAHVASRVSALKPYDYALLPKELLIVNPNDKKVVNVIKHRA